MNFDFGQNWENFIADSFNEERVSISKKHLLDFLRVKNLSGLSFLDVGCGSGLHSLAAFLAGAESIYSFDLSEKSVAATTQLWEMVGSPEHWVITQGSILDDEFVSKVPQADVVYSWGVLHHTGRMWEAVDNALKMVSPGGLVYIALYADEMYQNPSPEFWIETKKKYNMASEDEKREMECWYAWEYVLKYMASQGENPFMYINNYKKDRGMEFWTDIRDWLGGYPMEFAKAKDVVAAAQSNGLEVLSVSTGHGNTEFLFANDPCDELLQKFYESKEVISVASSSIEIHKGFAFCIDLSGLSVDLSRELAVFEGDRFLGFPNAPLESVIAKGEGRFCQKDSRLYFSCSDNSSSIPKDYSYSLKQLSEVAD